MAVRSFVGVGHGSAALRSGALGAIACIVSPDTGAHELLLRYELPVPFNLYLYACATTLAITFALLGWFMRRPAAISLPPARAARNPRPTARLSSPWIELLRAGAFAWLGLTIVAGLWGTSDPDRNVAPTLFWQVFLLGLTYATAVFGDFFAVLNPWRLIADWAWGREPDVRRATYPPALGYWPAVVLFVALTWLELFDPPRPRALGQMFVGYSLLTLAGAWLFGKTAWFRYAEGFSVFFRTIGVIAPISYHPSDDGLSVSIRLRPPFSGAVEQRADSMSLVVFVLALLAMTTYDGIHQTVFWMGLFWTHLLPFLYPSWQANLHSTQGAWESLFSIYQRLGLVVGPLFYLAFYLLVLWVARVITRASLSIRDLALAFIFSLLPIVLVYNFAHNYTLLLTRAYVLPYLFSDPFGLGWNVLALPHLGDPPTLDMRQVWHVEVFSILAGHLVSVYLAHHVALRIFKSRREAVLSQVPMLMLMLAYTILGLWVISLPFALT
jgi:hypothetical protein